MTKEEEEEIVNDWSKEWRVPVPRDQLRQEEEQLQESNSDNAQEEEDPSKELYFTESHSPSISIDP